MPEYLHRSFNVSDPELVSLYDEVSLWSSMLGMVFLDHIPLKPNLNVLDIGFGSGFPLLELAQRLGDSCRVYGIDLWQAAIRRVIKKIEFWDIPNVNIIESDGSAMPFKDNTFDLIVSNLGINNFENPQQVFKECKRVAKPGTQIALTTNLTDHMKEFYTVFAHTLREMNRPEMLEKLNTHINHRSNVEAVCAMMEQVGFRVAKIHRQSFNMRFLNGSSLFRHRFIQLAFLNGWKQVVSPGDETEVFTKLEDNLNRLAEEKGELKLTIPMAYIQSTG